MTSPSAPVAVVPEPASERADPAALTLSVPWAWCAVLAAIPAVLAVWQLGRAHPDEVYQFLEPAYFRVHGYGILAWEWRDGLRNWGFPLVIAGVLKIAGWLGVRDPFACRALIELPQWALNVWALASVYRYAQRRLPAKGELGLAGRAPALLALLLVALIGTSFVYAGRTMGESLSAAFLLIALEALDRNPATWRDGALGGLALGLAVVARYGSAIFVLVALGWLLGTRRYRVLLACAAAGLLVALGLGALDWATWGAPFHSLIAYSKFNVFSTDAARRFGEMSPRVYLLPLVDQVPLWIVPGLVLGLWRERPRVSLAGLSGVLYVTALFFTLHKEDRFLYPGMVVLAMAAAPHVAGWAWGAARWRWAAVSVALVLSVGTYAFGPDVRGDQFHAIVKASRDAHGLLIVNEGVWGAGGFFYVGRNIPWWTCDWPSDPAFRAAMTDTRFDRAVTFDGRALEELKAAGFHPVEQVGRETILAR